MPGTRRCIAVEDLNNIGTAMAFGYFYYLKDGPFERLYERLCDIENDTIKMSTFLTTKLLILVPETCKSDVRETEKFKHKTDVETIKIDVASVEQRQYPLSVYELKTKNDQGEIETKYFALETASCLDWLSKLEEEKKINGSTKDEIRNQFLQILNCLLESDVACKDEYIILTYSESENIEDVILNYHSPKPIPDLDIPLEINNLGKGLAHWYYHNYLLNRVVPLLENQINEWEQVNNKPESDIRVVRKLFIIVPTSCYVIKSFRAVRGNIRYAGLLTPTKQPTGATKNRLYQKNVIRVSNDEGKKHFCVAEYATPIRQLYRMFNNYRMPDKLTALTLSNDDMKSQRHEFILGLNHLLGGNPEANKLCTVCGINDEVTHVIADTLLLRIGRALRPRVRRICPPKPPTNADAAENRRE